jgi:hypothetical protein
MAILNQPGFANMAGAPQALQMAYMRDPRLRLAQQLQMSGSDTSPVGHWTQGLARLAQALAGNRMEDRADSQYRGQAEAYQNDMRGFMAPIMEQGTAGPGPRQGPGGATMRPATFAELSERAGKFSSPYAMEAARPLMQQAMQQEAAAAARGTYSPVKDDAGNVIGQRNSASGKIDYVPAGMLDQWEPAAGPGGLQGQRNRRTNEWKPADTRPQTIVNTPVTVKPPKFETELQKFDAQRIRDYENNVLQARRLLPDLDRLEAAVNAFPTGIGGSGVLAFRQAMDRLGVKIDGTTEGEVIQSIQSRLAPAMRPEGSGSSSNMDVQMFMDSLPNLFRTPNGNMAIIRHMRHITRRQQQEATFMRNYMHKNGSLGGVYEAMDAELGPVFPRVKTPEEADKLAPGSLFVDPTGMMRVR